MSLGLKGTLLFLCLLISFSAFAQKDILLYSTDFTDWDPITESGSSSNPYMLHSGAGDGFTITEDATVDPTGTGTYWLEGSTSGRELGFPPFDFLVGGDGAVVELEFEMTGGSSNRIIEILGGGTVTSAMIDEYNQTGGTVDFDNLKIGGLVMHDGDDAILTTTKLGVWHAGEDNVQISKSGTGTIKISLWMPGVSGSTALTLGTMRQDIPLKSINVYTAVGAMTYVASPEYLPCADDAAGLTISGITGGGQVSGNIDVKGWNLSGDMTLSVVGADAAKFSLPTSTIALAAAEAGQTIAVDFMPSVITGVSNAQLIISSAGSPDYCVSLTGLTASGGGPQITTQAVTWKFAAGVIQPVSQNIPISGVNLTGPVTLSLSGADAAQFSLSSTQVSLADAMAGTPINVTYLGGVAAPYNHTVDLVLTSPGATSVTVPLEGLTFSAPPVTYTLTKNVTPGGTGVLVQDLGGSVFPAGTTVKVTAMPETGYRFVRWTDNGSTALVRQVLMTSNKNITAEFEIGAAVVITPFNAYAPITGTITNTSFTARWNAVAGATSYTVTVLDDTGAVVDTQVTAALSRNITGLTIASKYTYSVTANTGEVTNTVGPIKTTGTLPVPACGTIG